MPGLSKTKFLVAAKEAAHKKAWPETQFVAGAKWAYEYLAEEK